MGDFTFNTEMLGFALIVGGSLILIGLERLFPYNKNQPFFREGFWNDLLWYTFIQSYFLQIVIFAGIIHWIDSSTDISRLKLISDWPIWLQVAFFTVTHDLYIYWAHRFQHKNKVLWRTHEAHHSPIHVDWIAGSRSHAGEILVNQTIEFAPIVLLGAPPEVVVWKGVVSAIWGMYIHANIDVRSGWLQYIINGPEMHRWHHADWPPEALDKNFGTKLAIWDWIFGTAYLPDGKAQEFGLAHSRFPLSEVEGKKHARLQQLLGWEWLRQNAFAFRSFKYSREEQEKLAAERRLREQQYRQREAERKVGGNGVHAAHKAGGNGAAQNGAHHAANEPEEHLG